MTDQIQMRKKSQTIISILGMHRSGTSCLTGCLQDCGLYLGDVVNEAPHNRKGNKENLRLRDINDQVLLYSAGSWDNPPEQLLWNDDLRRRRDQLIAMYSDHNQWGFKDPRTLLTLPFWLEALPNLKFIGTFRHPIAVTRSIQQREGLAIELMLTLWKKYNLKLIEYLELYDFPLVCFDWPAEVYKQTVINFSRSAGLNKLGQTEQIPFYESSLRQQNSEDIDVTIPPDILGIYEKLYTRAEYSRLFNE